MNKENSYNLNKNNTTTSENLINFIKALRDKDEEKQEKIITSPSFNSSELLQNALSPLALATLMGASAKIANLLLKAGEDINSTYLNGMNILHLAAASGNSEVANFAIRNNIDLKAVDEDGNTFLHIASTFSKLIPLLFKFESNKNLTTSIEKLEKLSASTTNLLLDIARENDFKELITIKNNAGLTPILSAAQIGNKEILEIFFKMGSNLTDVDLLGNNILLAAASNRNLDGIVFALEHKINPNSHNNAGYNALEYSIWSDGIVIEENDKVVTKTLSKIHDQITTNKENSFCYDNAIFALEVQPKYGMETIPDIFKLLLNAGTNPNVSRLNFPLLQKLIAMGQTEVVDLMLNYNTTINAVSLCNTMALNVAITFHHKDIIKNLLAHGANYEFSIDEKNGDTYLHKIAANEGNQELLSAFIDSKVDLNIKNKYGLTSLDKAIINQRIDTIKILVKNNASITNQDQLGNYPIHYAAVVNNAEVIEILANEATYHNITKYIDVQNKLGYTPLFLALYEDNRSINAISKLLDLGANQSIKNIEGETPLHFASLHGNLAVVKMLLKENVEVDINNDGKNTPLMLASAAGQLVVMEELIKHNANVNAVDITGDSVLSLVVNDGLQLIQNLNASNPRGQQPSDILINALSYLIKKEANINFVRENGQNLLHIAAEKANLDIFKFLHKAGVDCLAKTNDGSSTFTYANDHQNYDIAQYINTECKLVGENEVLL